jgi:hypothetical protein
VAIRDRNGIQNVSYDDMGGSDFGSDFGGDFDGDLGVDFGGDRFSGGDSFGNEGGDISGAGGGNSSVGEDVSGGKEISGGTGDIPTISDIMDRAAASGSDDALPGFTTPTANDNLDDNKSNPNDFPADTATNSTSSTGSDTDVVDSSTDKTNPNDFPTNTGTGDDDGVPTMTITDKRPTKPDVPEMVITSDRPIGTGEKRSIDGGGLSVTPAVTTTTPTVTPTVTPTTTTPAVTTPPVTTPPVVTPPVVTPPVVTPPVVTPPVVTPPTSGPGPGETEEEWRLRMGQTGYGNLTDFDKEVARLKGNMDTGVSTSKGLISANMKPPGG